MMNFNFIDFKKRSFLLVFFIATATLFAQSQSIDSLKREVELTRNDTTLFICLDALAGAYLETKPDSSLYYVERALAMSRKLNLKMYEAFTLGKKGYAQLNKGNYPGSLRTFLSAIEIADNAANETTIMLPRYLANNRFPTGISGHNFRLMTLGNLHEFTGILYENVNDYERELYHLRFTKKYIEESRDSMHMGELYYVMGRVYLTLQKRDSALFYEQRAIDLSRHFGLDVSGPLLTLGKYYVAIGEDQEAAAYLREALKESQRVTYLRGEIASGLLLSAILRKRGELDSSFHFTNNALELARQMGSPDLQLRAWSELVEIYSLLHRNDSIAKYQAMIIAMKDSVFNSKQAQSFHNIDFDEQQRRQEIETVRKTYKERAQKYGLLAGLIVFLSIAIILWRNNQNKQRAYSLLKRQKQETDFQKSKVERTLSDLRATQAQLIQSEKMASLGELTAGIAHEIENPLNFVNNFSEVNNELIEELKSQKSKLKSEEQDEILDDIKENNEKIITHGKRADAIVKGMLQHSRTSSGQKELTDINALADEYLRLAYHGMRAKDKSFAPITKTNFDSNIGKINVVRQEMGRVILNLINNAFHAVNEKATSCKLRAVSYEPQVSVKTERDGEKVLISVSDNGSGIADSIKEKIFQPFFTTKPTGQGTGLGLSLAYDIVKGHGGDIKLVSKEGEGSKFAIELPG